MDSGAIRCHYIAVGASAGFVRLLDRYDIIGHSFFVVYDFVPLTPCMGFQTDMLNHKHFEKRGHNDLFLFDHATIYQ